VIRAEKANFPVAFMCRQLGLSPSGYYVWERRGASRRRQEDEALIPKIRASHRASRGTYGSPRIYDDLKDQGETVGRHRIARLMRENGITARPLKRFRKTTDSNHDLPVAPNLLERNFEAARPNQVWVGDITYIWTGSGWTYLAVIVDLFSRRVVGWALDNNMRAELVTKALEQAVGLRQLEPGLIFHSDRGSQYASAAYQKALAAAGITPSMSRKGDCWDNAVAESFFSTLKRELVSKCYWLNMKAVRMAIHEYIEAFYNGRRKHSTNGNLSPVEYERRFQCQAAMAA
jgi:transposase InsO family protein